MKIADFLVQIKGGAIGRINLINRINVVFLGRRGVWVNW